MPDPTTQLSRRAFLWTTLAGGAALIAAACGARPAAAPTTAATAAAVDTSRNVPSTEAVPAEVAQTLPPTPACGTAEDPTLAQTEGPYFTPNSPERTSLLEPGIAGTPMVVTGYVLTTGCAPVANALLDFWHADDAGRYDNVGYKLRGHQFADAEGRFTLETIMPGLYPGRTRHFHVKVQAPNGPVLTTQLYFPDEPANARDGIYNAALLMNVSDTPEGKQGAFNFVLVA